MKIKINCTGTENISIDKFTELQGNLKELSKENYEKLKASIIKYGFSFPVFCFKLKNIYYIADAHQRVKTLKELRKEGYEVPELPTVFITAKDKKQAKELLLQLNSNYGKITNEGLYEYLNEPEFELNTDFLKDIDLPNIDMSFLNETETDFPQLRDGDREPFRQMTFILHDSQFMNVEKAIQKAKSFKIEDAENQNSNGNALNLICCEYIK